MTCTEMNGGDILEEILKKIRETYQELPREEPGVLTRIAVDGENLGLGRDAREQLQDIIDGLGKMAGKKGTCRVERIVDGVSAALLVGFDWEDFAYNEADLAELDFIVPADTKDPREEFGPAFAMLFEIED